MIETELKLKEDLMITVGCVGAPFGVRGWVHVQSFTAPVENITNYSTWYLSVNHLNNYQPVKVVCKRHHQSIVAQIDGCADRDKATLWRGKLIAIPRSMLPKLTEGQYYWTDLVGLKVVDLQGECLGEIDHLYETGANDVMVIKNTKTSTKQHIPFVLNDVVVNICFTTKTIVVDWLDF